MLLSVTRTPRFASVLLLSQLGCKMDLPDKERLFWTNVNRIYNPESSRYAFAPLIWSIKAATTRSTTMDLVSDANPDFLRPNVQSEPT